MFYRPTPNKSFYRIDASHRGHTGLKVVQSEMHRTWKVAIEHCVTGLTVRRDRYSARITDTLGEREEYLTGFCSRSSAIQAAQRRVDFILDIQDPHRKRKRRAG